MLCYAAVGLVAFCMIDMLLSYCEMSQKGQCGAGRLLLLWREEEYTVAITGNNDLCVNVTTPVLFFGSFGLICIHVHYLCNMFVWTCVWVWKRKKE